MKSDKGQTAVEYIVLLAAVAAMIFSVLTYLKGKLLVDGPCKPTEKSLACDLQRLTSSFGTDGTTFRYFLLRR